MTRTLSVFLVSTLALAACAATPEPRTAQHASERRAETAAVTVAGAVVRAATDPGLSTEATGADQAYVPPPPRDDPSTCEAAVPFANDFGTYWYGRTPQTSPRSAKVSAFDFLSVCHTMPMNAQRCMHDHYRTAHADECDGVFAHLDPAQTTLIDGVFVGR